MIALDLLSAVDTAEYEGMTFPSYRPLLRDLGSGRSSLAIGARLDGRPVGLALAELRSGCRIADLRSVFVVREQRHRGLGTTMLSTLERALLARGCAELHAVYTTGTPSSAIVERLLQRQGYEHPSMRTVLVRVSDEAAVPFWMLPRDLPPPFRVVPWHDVTHEDRAAMRRRQQLDQWIPSALLPWDHEPGYDTRTSVALRHDEIVVGWIITHALNDQMLRITCGWIRHDLRRIGRTLPITALAADVRVRALAAGFRQATWVAHARHPGMVGFTRRWVVPYAAFAGETRGTRKLLER